MSQRYDTLDNMTNTKANVTAYNGGKPTEKVYDLEADGMGVYFGLNYSRVQRMASDWLVSFPDVPLSLEITTTHRYTISHPDKETEQ